MNEREEAVTKEGLMASFMNVEELSRDDLASFYAIVRTTAFRKFMAKLLSDADAMSKVMLTIDLTNQVGVGKALRYQGEANGIIRAVESAAEFIVDTLAEGAEETEEADNADKDQA